MAGIAVARLSHDLPPFHDVIPIHSHAKCEHCLLSQREKGGKLSRCKACSVAVYCGKECQEAAWPTHKAGCKLHRQKAVEVAEKSGIPSGYADFLAWMAYYGDHLKNCAVAAYRLRTNPHSELAHTLFVELRHKGVSVTWVQGAGSITGLCPLRRRHRWATRADRTPPWFPRRGRASISPL
ncbi:hypothetical protein MKEN_00155000 [Mycena kentingensis (nom. inval.)]|nr:hypothetical protein MKEN_00155000 [Mycena kentingensis (nom. inval.)]